MRPNVLKFYDHRTWHLENVTVTAQESYNVSPGTGL